MLYECAVNLIWIPNDELTEIYKSSNHNAIYFTHTHYTRTYYSATYSDLTRATISQQTLALVEY